ncbi:MAG: hypothetical protein GXY55_03585 [Phycisphaerae bacterium]|nr:hypothetical protein [Phycisphaerae bacterium]
MQLRSITESPNELTTDIDVASPEGIVRLLRASDAQIYNGYRDYPAVCDDEIVARIAQAILWAAPLMGRRDAAIVISGAGTSGRLAMFAARTFNRHLATRRQVPNFSYLIAGTDLALIKAQEGAEDDPHQAITDLEPLIAGKKRILYVGITCAFAAPYVASQLWHLSSDARAKCILMGFNPENRARDMEVENWDKTFADVVRAINGRPNCMILNPVVGPEPVTGSTRMKGGSATKLLLETIFSLAAGSAGGKSDLETVREAITRYEQTRVTTYEQVAPIADLIRLGGQALRQGRHVYYLGTGSPGIVGLIDASECPPTYGAGFDDVRGFLAGGWRTLLGPGHDLSAAGPWYRISLDDFLANQASDLKPDDLVVALPEPRWSPALRETFNKVRRAKAHTAIVETTGGRSAAPACDVHIRVEGLPKSLLPGTHLFGEYATKLIANALTTAAHILCGKVYQNRMVDLRISNNKLYHRTLGILQDLMGVSAETARRCLLRSIYGQDRPTTAVLRAKPSQHVAAATSAAKVVPRALIMAGSRASYAEADRLLQREPVVRSAIERLSKKD